MAAALLPQPCHLTGGVGTHSPLLACARRLPLTIHPSSHPLPALSLLARALCAPYVPVQVDLYENGTIAIVEAVSPELGNRIQRVRVQLPGTSSELLQKFRCAAGPLQRRSCPRAACMQPGLPSLQAKCAANSD